MQARILIAPVSAAVSFPHLMTLVPEAALEPDKLSRFAQNETELIETIVKVGTSQAAFSSVPAARELSVAAWLRAAALISAPPPVLDQMPLNDSSLKIPTSALAGVRPRSDSALTLPG